MKGQGYELEESATNASSTSSTTHLDKPKVFSTVDLLLISVAIIWGVNSPIVKVALSEFSPLSFNALRFIIATTCSWGLLLWLEPRRFANKKDLPYFIWLGFLGHTLYQVLFIFGIDLTSAGNTALLLATIPIWTAVLSGLFKLEQLTSRAWIGIFISFFGISFITIGGGQQISLSLEKNTGNLLVLSAALVMAYYTIKSKPMLSRYTPLQFSTYTMTAGAICLLLFSTKALTDQDWALVSVAGWGSLVFSAVLAIVGAYYAWNYGIQKLGATKTSVYGNMAPVVAMLSSWVILQERISYSQILGAALIIAGLYLARSSRIKEKKGSQKVSY